MRSAAADRDAAQQARAAQQEEGQRLQREVWAAENTIDVAERLAAFIASPQAPGTDRFALALRFENGAPARISRDAAGKLFYGAFRLPGEEMKQFLEFLVAGPEPALAQQLTDAGGAKAAETGADAFRRAWKSVSEIAVFQALQSEWIDQSAYRPMIKRLNESARKRGFAGFAVETRSVALQAVLWSVALEFGPNTAVVATAWAGIDPGAVADGMLICRVFAARRKSDKNEAEPEVTRNLLKARYQLEEREALRMLAAEAGSEPQRECPK